MKKEDMKISEMYDLSQTEAADYLSQFTYPWEALAGIGEFVKNLGNTLSESRVRKTGRRCVGS